MLRSYVGITTPYGLESFLPEDEGVVQILREQAHRGRKERRVCYWAVVPEAAAREVARLLDEGNGPLALATLDCSATQVGLIPPLESPGLLRRCPGCG